MKKLALLLLFASANVYGQSTVSRVIHVTGAAFDLSTTITTPTREMNPIMGQHAPQQVVAMSTLAFALDHMTKGLGDQHPRFATTLNIMAGVAHFAAGSWNIHVIKQGRN